MSRKFRAWMIDQPLLLPVTVQDFVGEDHFSRFVLYVVRKEVDLTKITGWYVAGRGQPPFNPTMMVTLLLYAYSRGIYSSRRIAGACRERLDFMSIAGLDVPDFRTIAEFRVRHLDALSELFLQVLRLCEKAGLVKLEHAGLDGTKIKANASKHKAMSYGRMENRIAELEAEVAKWFSTADAIDAEEDKLHGRDKTGQEMPAWVADKRQRAEKIRAAKAELEAEAKAAAEAKRKAQVEAEEERKNAGRRASGRPPAPPSEAPDTKAQKNFTDPESRIMKSKDGFVQAYNAQIAVDAKAQVIVAQYVTQSPGDSGQLLPLTDAIEANLGRKPEQVSADNGYCSDANLQGLEERKIDGYVATGRARDAVADTAATEAAVAPAATEPTATPAPETPAAQPAEAQPIKPAETQATDPKKPTRVEAMRAKIKAGGHASPYRLRKQLPEPVFGQIKQARGFRQFLLRGFKKVQGEWTLVCTVHNLLKLAQGRSLSAASLQAAAAA
jgi:transposase